MAANPTAKDSNTLTEWFLSSIAADPLPLDHLVGVLEGLARDGQAAKSEEWAERLGAALTERGDGPGLVRALQVSSLFAEDARAFRAECRATLGRIFKDREQIAFLESAGFDLDLPAGEPLRRLRVLLGLRPNTFCTEKTWGFGIVQRVDPFYKKVTINFSRKPGHQMSFAYAAEVLQSVGSDHLLAVRHAKPAELTALARERADEVVRLALRSFGPLTVTQLQELIAAEKLDDGDWKAFWDRARKALKEDPFVDVPAKRSEPIRLLQTQKAYDDVWFAAFQKERDIKTILQQLTTLEKSGSLGQVTPSQRSVLAERACFAVIGAEDRQPEVAARLLLAADRMKLGGQELDLIAAQRRLIDPTRLFGCMSLPARELDALLVLLKRDVPEGIDAVVALLPRLPVHALHVALDTLRAENLTEKVIASIRNGLLTRSVSAEVLDYLCEHRDLISQWSLGTLSDVLHQVVAALELTVTLEPYKTQKQLRERFEDRGWIEDVLGRLDERERIQLLSRIRQSRGWDESSRRSLMGRIIKLYPSLGTVLAKPEKKDDEDKESHFTSWRSYRERQAQLKLLVEVTIPENSKEIGVARSYGDLRENFEYQAAKDQQRLLMRRQSELERDLNEVKGTDFSNVAADHVTLGTGVVIERPDGARQEYWVLGEWDRDEALNIISNKSEIAKRLEGAKVGDRVEVPGDLPGNPSVVSVVQPLNDPIRAWARGNA